MAFDVEDVAELAARDDLAQGSERRPEAAVVADREHDAGRAAGLDHAQRVAQLEGERLLAEHLLAGLGARHDLLAVQRVRRRQHDRLDRRIAQHVGQAFGRREAVRGGVVADLVDAAVDPAHEAQPRALALHRLDEALAPAAEPDDRGVDHDGATR